MIPLSWIAVVRAKLPRTVYKPRARNSIPRYPTAPVAMLANSILWATLAY